MPEPWTTDNAQAAASGDVVGGTAFFFAQDENVQAFDWLFVDEVGQVDMNALRATSCWSETRASCPKSFKGRILSRRTSPVTTGCWGIIRPSRLTAASSCSFLRRMHPEVCRFISDQVYEGRMASHPDAEGQGCDWHVLFRSVSLLAACVA
ncbi:hypothetical protein [Paracoccus sp. SSK6]|uniref:hypothetical protein n=1 Tax=Paracoccus sp. SSK6 TaxID=3143131 RepID=UPI003219E92F